ncbi:TPA: translation initiation factor IF-2 [Patescibacteria group bacterium]|uniref:Translation initiation factor IF-2 n=1 Tax=Candidatus Gottesmanbacteria bacterium GW2011_GWA1_43_11 TaxID=1618436 RepID=A0A0G1EN31_9BACT|nr:MAG: Translation initiation factor IF-2 [Candidatus Gottesmanbacteria bacterium GW2011_GWA1_43_11]HCS79439.1 translation initiation factor IF-2 [Patescibacteria group bacterium]
MKNEHKTSVLSSRPPVVAVLGHVDHGKTSLLDTIRKTHLVDREAGGITQHIGAYQIDFLLQKITFIDTPGHEAFAKMRSRGVQAADIGILVVAATEGVKPQTIESIKHLKAAGIPFLVALNKIDLPEANAEKVISELARAEVLVEKFGGDVVVLPVSAKTGVGIDKLLDTILLIAGLKGITADPNAPLEAIVIEAKMDKRRGPLATLIVKNGTLKRGQTIYTETTEAKVRALYNDLGREVEVAPPGFPVEVMGWKALPVIGSLVTAITSETAAVVNPRFAPRPFVLPPLDEQKKPRIILKVDVAGSLEAIKENLGEVAELVSAGNGDITDSDVLLAKSARAIIIGFNVKIASSVRLLAETENVRFKLYTIIYDLLDEIREVAELINKPEAQEEILGEAVILVEFPMDNERIAGCKIESGRIAKGDLLRLTRGDTKIGETKIKSLRQSKKDVVKTEVGSECGIVFEKKLDFRVNDRIIAFKRKELLV